MSKKKAEIKSMTMHTGKYLFMSILAKNKIIIPKYTEIKN
jgi:hypothetical protein